MCLFVVLVFVTNRVLFCDLLFHIIFSVLIGNVHVPRLSNKNLKLIVLLMHLRKSEWLRVLQLILLIFHGIDM